MSASQAALTEARPTGLSHQFESSSQQAEAGKLGMWLLILTEVLFFSGVFCAYAVFRAARPEVFNYAHYFLDRTLGACNTCLLLVSSFSAVCAVYFARRAARRKLMLSIVLTVALGTAFLVIKGVEYAAKAEEGLLPGSRFNPSQELWERESFKRLHPQAASYARALRAGSASARRPKREAIEPLLRAGVLGKAAEYPALPSVPRNAHVFFGIYLLMTGLHAVHVLLGLAVWIWLLTRAAAGSLTAGRWSAVEYTALYWHLVDVIWIYLFPLLYLSH
jgi:cytochrome c oxidase subunit III